MDPDNRASDQATADIPPKAKSSFGAYINAFVALGLAAILLTPVSALAHHGGRQGQPHMPMSGMKAQGATPWPAYLPPPRSGRIIILRDAWFGPNRVRGRSIPVQEIAPGIYLERGQYHWLDPLGVFTR